MSNTLTLTNLIEQVRLRTDTVNSQFVTDAELTQYINSSMQELRDVLVQKYGDDYFVADPYVIPTNGTDDTFPLPADFQKLLGVDLALAPSQDSYVTIRPFMFADRNRYAVPNFQSFYGVTNLRYRLRNNSLWLTPIPQGGQNIRIHYIPQLAPLVNGTDVADNLGGWLEYVVVDVCIKVWTKEESDVSVFAAQKDQLLQRIEAAAENRDAGNPQVVSDSQYSDWWWPNGGNGNGGFY